MQECERLELEVNQELIFRDALKRWGLRAQLDMIIEEASELIQALCKYYRRPNSIEVVHNLIEEAVDIQLCLNQLLEVLLPEQGVNAAKLFQKKYWEKLKRLEERVYAVGRDHKPGDDSLAWH